MGLDPDPRAWETPTVLVKKLAALLLASASLGLAAAGCGGGGNDTASGTADMAAQGKKKCEAGYIDARLPWGRRCLVHGQYCRKSRDKAYHKFGFHCHTSARLD